MRLFNLSVILIMIVLNAAGQSQVNDTIYLWPGKVPGETAAKSQPEISPNNSRNVIRISSVTNPAIVVYPADPAKNNGAGVVVCPGGGYNILAINLEGYEIATWLNNLGYSAFVLEYRVPQKQKGALQDVQRALRVVRQHADQWQLDPDNLGVMGFSAGGSLSARAETLWEEQTYEPIDGADKLSCRPSFAMLIYPAYLDKGPGRTITPELQVNANTPPTFIFATADDKYSNGALVMAAALRDAGVPVELHLMPVGGHGYGLRKGNPAAELWPKLAATWLSNILADQ